MDSSVNINPEIISFLKQYLLSNTDVLKEILTKLETISNKSRESFKSVLTKDNRIDNHLLEINQSKRMGLLWFDTYRIGLRETLNWFVCLNDNDQSSEIDAAKHLCIWRIFDANE